MSLIGVQLARRHMFADAEEVEDRAVTIRPSSTALFCIDSEDRYASLTASRGAVLTSPYSFSINRNQSLLNGFFKRIALTEIVFPYYIPNVNSRTSELFYDSSVAGSNRSITIGEAFYTPSQLASAVQTALIADGATGVTVTYTDGRFYVDAGVGNTIDFFPSSNPPTIPSTSTFQLFDLMGFTTANGTPARTQTSMVTRCRYTEYLDIVCSQLTYNQDLKDGSSDPVNRDILARVYLEGENDQPIGVYTTLAPTTVTTVPNTVPGTYPFTIYRQFKNPKQIKWNETQPLGNLTFQVYDSHGDLLASPDPSKDWNYPDWRMTLLVSEN